jgi:hypothetical protein
MFCVGLVVALAPTEATAGMNLNDVLLRSPSCSVEYYTVPNSYHEWAAHMTAVFDPPPPEYTVQISWWVRGAFSNWEWVDYTHWARGRNSEFLTVEDLYGRCFEVWIEVAYLWSTVHMFECTTDPIRVCYGGPIRKGNRQ